jgi:membrane-bound lytic murein transglycosylase D
MPLLLAMLCVASPARAAEEELDLGEALDAAQEWAEQNLDDSVLAALPEVDRKQVEDFLKLFQVRLHGSNVLDLATYKDTAKMMIPLLDRYEETSPLAAWLRTRLDYFEVAEELKKAAPATRGPGTNPPPAEVQTIWVTKLSRAEWPERAKELVPKLKPIFQEEKVPPELVWVAEVESSFNPKARSPVGAAGLFQLMPATAKRFGLRTWPFDQRYQPEASARVAAQYLNFLGKKFGDWRLALAAYNSGEGTVQRLLDKHNAKTFDAIATRLPAETQMFVPKIEATILRREGRALPLHSTRGK